MTTPELEAEMAHVTANGLTMAFDEAGRDGADGERVLLLVHGHPFDRTMWQPQMAAAAAAGWRVVAPDLRGYGATDVTPGRVTLDMFADDLAALLDVLGIRTVVAGGLSMGGQIVMALADRYPNRLRGLVLAATFPRIDSEEGRAFRLATADRLEREGMGPYAAEVLPKMLAPGTIAAQPDVAAFVLRMMRAAPARGAAAALRGRADRRPYAPVLAATMLPALVVVGDEDAFTTRADATEMQALLTGSDLVWMEGVGHMPNLERPAAFNDALMRFLARV
jgi:pimeloyl-ACP methyl ester carboxylesterase